MRKFNGTYYFIYSSLNSHELCYATSDNPTEGFEFGGVLVSNGDIGLSGITDVRNARNCTGNTHGSLIEISLPVRPVQSASASRMANSIRQR